MIKEELIDIILLESKEVEFDDERFPKMMEIIIDARGDFHTDVTNMGDILNCCIYDFTEDELESLRKILKIPDDTNELEYDEDDE